MEILHGDTLTLSVDRPGVESEICLWNGRLSIFVYETKPYKTYDGWMDCGTETYTMLFKDTFHFIKWGDEPLSVNKILNNCEVIEDE